MRGTRPLSELGRNVPDRRQGAGGAGRRPAGCRGAEPQLVPRAHVELGPFQDVLKVPERW